MIQAAHDQEKARHGFLAEFVMTMRQFVSIP